MPVIQQIWAEYSSLVKPSEVASVSKLIHIARAKEMRARARQILLNRYPPELVGADEIDAVLSLYFADISRPAPALQSVRFPVRPAPFRAAH